MFNIILFASGEGTNAENIMNYFGNSSNVCVKAVITNRSCAGVLAKAEAHGVSTIVINRTMLEDAETMLPLLEKYDTDLIVLAGFLLLLPSYLVRQYPGRILNIHPSLIPLHCGKGMYGMKVHEDVIKSGEKKSGITIHYIDENYDRGEIILQKSCAVMPEDTPEDLVRRIHELEYSSYPTVIESIANNIQKHKTWKK